MTALSHQCAPIFRIVVFFAFLFLPCPPQWVSGAEHGGRADDPLSAAQAQAQSYRLKCDAIRVEFTTKIIGGTIRSLPGLYNSHIFAAVGDRRYFEIQHRDARLVELTDFTFNRQYYDGVEHLLFYPNQRVLHRRKSQEARERRRDMELLLDATGTWPASDFSRENAPETTPYYNHEILNGNCVNEGCQFRDGQRCLVVSLDGTSRLFLDETIDFQPRLREFYSGRDAQGRPTLRCTFALADFRLVSNGAWFPYSIQRRIETLSYEGGDVAYHLVVGTVAQVREVQVGITFDQFAPGALDSDPGTIVVDGDLGEPRQVIGGLDLLDHVAVLARARTDELNALVPGQRHFPGESVVTILTRAALAALIAAAVVLVARAVVAYLGRKDNDSRKVSA